VARFRCGNTQLEVVLGVWKGVPYVERLCWGYDLAKVEDEEHLLLVYPNTQKVKERFCLALSLTHTTLQQQGAFLRTTYHRKQQRKKFLKARLFDTKTFAPVQSQVLHNYQTWNIRKTFPIITTFIYCLRLTLHQKLFATNPSPQRLSESTQKSIGFRCNIYRKPLAAFWKSQQVCVRFYIENR
jgi:hypothetical protein